MSVHAGVLYHRTCTTGAMAIVASGNVLRPNRHPLLRHSLVWLADSPDVGRLALGLTSYSLDCDRMAVLFETHDTDHAMHWPRFARMHGYPVGILEVRGTRTERWWVSMRPMFATLVLAQVVPA